MGIQGRLFLKPTGSNSVKGDDINNIFKFYTEKRLKKMNNEFLNALVMYRNNAGLTQEQASEKLCISGRSLINYETGKTNVPDDIVNKMTKIYNAPVLGYYWLRNTQTGKNILPALAKSSLAESGLSFFKHRQRV